MVFAFTNTVFASNEIKSGTYHTLLVEKSKPTETLFKKKLDPDYSVCASFYFGNCPDGSEYYAGAIVFIIEGGDCETGNIVGGFIDNGYSLEEGCD